MFRKSPARVKVDNVFGVTANIVRVKMKRKINEFRRDSSSGRWGSSTLENVQV